MSVFLATFTTFVDDYKLRGQDPSTAHRQLFKTRTAACKFICKALFKRVVDCIDMDEMETHLRDDAFTNLFDYDKEKNDIKLKANMEDDVDALLDYAEQFREGEYVPACWECDIEEYLLTDLE